MVLALSACRSFDSFPSLPLTPTPLHWPTLTPTPVCTKEPAIRLTSSAVRIKVGETLTLTAEAIDVGMPQYRLSLSSGANVIAGSSTPQVKDDDIFAIVSVSADGKQTFVLRGKKVGTAEARVGASGELGCYNTGYYWGAASSEPLHLEVTP